MSKKRKLLAAIRNNPSGVRFDDLVRLVEALGFERERGEGSHAIYVHARAEVPFLNLQTTKDGKAKTYQVEQVLDRVDSFNLEVE